MSTRTETPSSTADQGRDIAPAVPSRRGRKPSGGKVGPPVEEGTRDEVDRAVAAVDRAIGRLVGLLDHDDSRVASEALLALDDLGGDAVVGPLAAALGRSRSPRLRLV